MCLSAAAPGDRYEVRVKYFHPMHFDTVNGRYVLELPTVIPKVRVMLRAVKLGNCGLVCLEKGLNLQSMQAPCALCKCSTSSPVYMLYSIQRSSAWLLMVCLALPCSSLFCRSACPRVCT